ncbi:MULTISPECIES: hypothetical protein [unclassified Rhizobium]|uniref:hypothetical protein n=1 Tax=unclassified Rhizobium TaxID=2613769 RepID=UPI00380AF615
MTASAIIKESDLHRMAKIAKRDGVRVEIEVNGKIIRVSPDIPVIHKSDDVDAPLPTGSNALSEWRRLNESRFGGNSPRQKKAR